MQRTTFKRCELFQDILCRLDYDERVVVSFDNQIQSEYYGVNVSVFIEVIELEHFSSFTKGRYKFNYTIMSKSCIVSLF